MAGPDQAKTTELTHLSVEVEGLRRGLTTMVAAQATQTEMLKAILQATAAPTTKENPTVAALAELTAALKAQVALLSGVATALDALPDSLAQEVAKGVEMALSGLSD